MKPQYFSCFHRIRPKIHNEIGRYRLQLGITQRELGRKCGVRHPTGRPMTLLLLLASLAFGDPVAARAEELPRAEFGRTPGHFTPDRNGFRHKFVPDSGFGDGVYAVPIDADRLLALDLDSAVTRYCTRIDPKPFTFPHDTRGHYRFRCDAALAPSEPLFVATDQLRPIRGEALEWRDWPEDSAVRLTGHGGLHRYVATAQPALLNGLLLITTATFSGRYPPLKEFDELREDSITFGHYEVRDRVLYVGRSVGRSVRTWLEAPEVKAVEDGLEWAFLPGDASEKTDARFKTLFTTPNGYLLVLRKTRDHEGSGFDETVDIFSFESGRWRRRATAERTWMY